MMTPGMTEQARTIYWIAAIRRRQAGAHPPAVFQRGRGGRPAWVDRPGASGGVPDPAPAAKGADRRQTNAGPAPWPRGAFGGLPAIISSGNRYGPAR